MEIEYGYCHCGCGEKTAISERNIKSQGIIKGIPMRFIRGHNSKISEIKDSYRERYKGSGNPNWKGGRTKTSKGYIGIYMPSHARAKKSTGYVLEHILIAEKALGKALPPKAEIHHLNGSKDNGPLVICPDRAYHMLLHQRERALRATGHAGWRKCPYCKKYDMPGNMKFYSRIKHIKNAVVAYHKECRWQYRINRMREKR